MKKLILVFSILILLLSSGFSVWAKVETTQEEMNDLIVRRTAPDSVFLNQKIWIAVTLENKSAREKNINFIERLGEANFDETQAKYIETNYGEKLWYYEWKIKLSANKETTLAYWLVPKKLGSYIISPAKISVDAKSLYIKSGNITVRCRPDEKCDLNAGENYLTCPEDCQTGLADGICDFTQDGRCDPDCKKGADSDCQKEHPKNIYYYLAVGALAVLVAGTMGIKISKRFKRA